MRASRCISKHQTVITNSTDNNQTNTQRNTDQGHNTIDYRFVVCVCVALIGYIWELLQ